MVAMVRQKERIYGRLFRSPLEKMRKQELDFLLANTNELEILLTKTPISRDAITRQQGINGDEMDWLVKHSEEYKKEIQQELTRCKGRRGVYTTEEVLDALYDNKTDVIGMIRDRVRPEDIFWELNIIKNMNAFYRFRDDMIVAGYQLPRGRRKKEEQE